MRLQTISIPIPERNLMAKAVCPILQRLTHPYQTLLIYLSLSDEFPTYPLLAPLYIGSEQIKTIVIPWCDGEKLRLFRLLPHNAPNPWRRVETFGELLCPGAFHIPEPRLELRDNPLYEISPQEIDLAIVPGRAFDRRGNRLGRGKGYYDRFLPQLRGDCPLIGLGYSAQIIDTLPVEPHDRPMNQVVTEQGFLKLDEGFI